jgi:ribosome biogenesis GTPase A
MTREGVVDTDVAPVASSATTTAEEDELVAARPTHCGGCGVPFQEQFRDQPGFVRTMLLDAAARTTVRDVRGADGVDMDIAAGRRRLQFNEAGVPVVDGKLAFDADGDAYEYAHGDGGGNHGGSAGGGNVGGVAAVHRSVVSGDDAVAAAVAAGEAALRELRISEIRRQLGEDAAAAVAASGGEVVTNVQLERAVRAARSRRRPVCVRCHELTHNNGAVQGRTNVAAAPAHTDLLQATLAADGARSAVVLLVVDVFDLTGSLLPDLENIIGTKHVVIVVVNKMDLLPPSVLDPRSRDAALVNYIRAEMARMNIRIGGVQLASAVKGYGLPSLMQRVAKVALPDRARKARSTRHRHYSRDKIKASAVPAVGYTRDLYVVGATNVGKSTLINRLKSERVIRTTGEPVTASHVPGTTYGLVAFPLVPHRNGTLYDTPGVVNNSTLTSHLTLEELVCSVRVLVSHQFYINSVSTFCL